MAGPLTVDIVAQDRPLWSGTADRVIAPSVEGEIGLLANHEPVLSLLKAGTVRVRSGSETHEFAISQGFVSFDHNVITIGCTPAESDED